MNLQFNDNNLALVYLQTKLKEEYNNLIIINGDYYKNFNNNYGFAHYVVKYLNLVYPPANPAMYDENLPDETFEVALTPNDCISIANYYQCANNGTKLLLPEIENGMINNLYPDTDYAHNTYIDIYSHYISSIKRSNDSPIFINDDYSINKKERIYNLYSWRTDKGICELDDLVMSYLLGRTIGPNSSREQIHYAQKLIIGESNIQINDAGVWDSNSGNMTDLIIQYQRAHINVDTTYPLFVTGYFDIYTEASLLRDRGEQLYGIYGL